MQNVLRVGNVVLGCVNVALFVFWLALIRIEAISIGAEEVHAFDQLSFQITILEAVVALAGVILAVLGFVGFQIVLERAEARADKTARETVQRLHERGQLASETTQYTGISRSMPAASTMPTDSATKEEDV